VDLGGFLFLLEEDGSGSGSFTGVTDLGGDGKREISEVFSDFRPPPVFTSQSGHM
jgi:hypothetical protein